MLAANDLLPGDTTQNLVQLFKLLSDETRLQILHILRKHKEVNVLTLCKLLRLRQPSVSHHLALLRVNHIIDMRREGKHNYYRLLSDRFQQLLDLLFESSGCLSRPMAALQEELRLGVTAPQEPLESQP